MKSSELADLYFALENKEEALNKILCQILADMSVLIKARNPKTVTGFQSILRETNDKYNAVNRRIGGVLVKDGFYILIAKLHPEMERFLPPLELLQAA